VAQVSSCPPDPGTEGVSYPALRAGFVTPAARLTNEKRNVRQIAT
jgi:hypothetical protein